MRKFGVKTIKATIINLIVALLIIILTIGAVKIFFGARIDEAVTLVSKVSINDENKNVQKTVLDNNKITNYPEYGTEYATIKIPKIDVDLPVYYGDTLEVLKKGVGHSSGSYFPGEGGTIIYMGHNSKKVFRRFSELQKGNEIDLNDYLENTSIDYSNSLTRTTTNVSLKINKTLKIFLKDGFKIFEKFVR